MLTPQMIDAMNKATGNNVPLNGKPASNVPSRADEIRALGKSSAPVTPAAAQPGYINRVASDVSSKISDIGTNIAKNEEDTSFSGAVGKGLNISKNITGAAVAPIAELPGMKQLGDLFGWAGKNISDVLMKNPTYSDAASKLADFLDKNPGVGDALATANNVLQLQGAKGAIESGIGLASDIKNTATGARAVADTLPKTPPPETPVNSEASTIARDAAWKDIQPKATDKTVQAYRAQGATNPKTPLKGVTLNPSGADTKVLDTLTPLYEDGTINPKMTTEAKMSALETKSRGMASQADKLVEDNNKIVETPEVQSALDGAKENSKVIFGTDTTLKSAYEAPQQAFLDQLKSGKAGATGTDTVSLRDTLKLWDEQMKAKFPNLWKSSATGEMSATDNARLNGIMDTHFAIRNLIADKLGSNVPYLDTLEQTSNLIKAQTMMNASASNLSKMDSFINLVRNHPYFTAIAGWETLKHTVAPGLPGI